MTFDKQQLPLYIGIGIFILIVTGALISPNTFRFLQSSKVDPDASGKCPKKCCTACSVNVFTLLIFGLGMGVAGFGISALLSKENRDKLTTFVGARSAAPSVSIPTPP